MTKRNLPRLITKKIIVDSVMCMEVIHLRHRLPVGEEEEPLITEALADQVHTVPEDPLKAVTKYSTRLQAHLDQRTAANDAYQNVLPKKERE